MEDKLVTGNDIVRDDNPQLNKWEKYNLKSASKWAKFTAITGLIFMGLLLILFLVAGGSSFFLLQTVGGLGSQMRPDTIMGTVFITVIGIYLPWLIFLLLFGIKTKNALNNQDSNKLEEGLMSLKQVFVIAGIYTIIALFISMNHLISTF